MTQFGPTIKNRIGSNLESTFSRQQEIRATIEEIKEYRRVYDILQQHVDGKISSLTVSYLDIVKDPAILDNVTPISREPDVDGKIILWEGYVRPKPDFFSGKPASDRGPLHRVIQHADGHRVFCKYRSTTSQWVICSTKDEAGQIVLNRFPKPIYRHPKSELWLQENPSVIARTVMKPDGSTEQRFFSNPIKTKTIRK